MEQTHEVFQLNPNPFGVRSQVLWLSGNSDHRAENRNIVACNKSIAASTLRNDQSKSDVPGSSMDCNNTDALLSRVKAENERLSMALKKVNMCLGDQIISDDSDSTSDSDNDRYGNPVNTRCYQIDELFAPKYYYITNVCVTK